MICNDSLSSQFFKLLFSLLLKSYVLFFCKKFNRTLKIKILPQKQNKTFFICINLFLQEIDFLLFFQIEQATIPGLPGGCL